MPRLEMYDLYPSPWSERLRWTLEWKGLPYTSRPFTPIATEPELRRETGIATAPVLIADGAVIGDSNAAVDWLEAQHPTPPLLPSDPVARARVRAWELAATEVLAPAGRLLMVGRYKALDLQPFAEHFATKYHWTPEEERRAQDLLRAVLPDVTAALADSPHLVGDGFTRADLTWATMLTPLLGLPPDELFAMDPGLRAMFGTELGAEPGLAGLRAWRDETYRRHRGGRVTPRAA